uniref:ATP-dependent RNA helicase n=1 Tax=Bursaphelenchus xylophilus TaxID=6326 RepID=A0A1I7SB48_BURXY
MCDISDLDDLVEDVKISNQKSSKNDSFSCQDSHGRSKERGNHGTCNFKVSGNLPGTSNFIRPVAQGEDDESVQVTVVSTKLDAKNFEYKSEFLPSKRAQKALDHLGFNDFLPVQRVAQPFISKFPSSDFIIKAPAGSGKTFAYLIPIIDQIQRIKEQENSKLINKVAPYAVVVAPTRELVSQLYQETKSYLTGQKTFNQRVGRIGRLGNKGHLTFFYNYRDDKVRSPQIRQVFEKYGSPIPPFLQPDEEKL